MLIYFLHRMRSKYVHAQTIEFWIFFYCFIEPYYDRGADREILI